MATVTGKTSITIDELVNNTVVSGYVTSEGVLILVTREGAEIYAGVIDPGLGPGSGGGEVVVISSPALEANEWSSNIVHGLNLYYPNVTAWNAATKELEQIECRAVDESTIQIRTYDSYIAGAFQLSIVGMSADNNDVLLEQTFASASNVWVVEHNLGTKGLNVYTENSLGNKINGDVSYPDDDHVQVSFYYPQTGLMRVYN